MTAITINDNQLILLSNVNVTTFCAVKLLAWQHVYKNATPTISKEISAPDNAG